MNLSDATPEQMACELTKRGLPFVLVATENEETNIYSPDRIDASADTVGIYTMLRDYMDHLDIHKPGLLGSKHIDVDPENDAPQSH